MELEEVKIDFERLVRTDLTGIDRHAPNVNGRATIADNSPPLRIYLHEFGADVFDSDNPRISREMETVSHALQTIGDVIPVLYGENQNPPLWIIAGTWGHFGNKILDIVCYSNIGEWPGNPDIAFYNTENGILVPRREQICGDMAIILGIEEEVRRRHTKDMEGYMQVPPMIDGLAAQKAEFP